MDDNLYEAATKGDVDYIEKLRLVDRWFSLDCQSHDGSNILHIALRHHHIPLIECVLDGSHMLMSWKDSKGDTPLHLAAGLFTNEAFTFLELCLNTWIFNKNEYYLEGPAPWKVRNSKGNTYLHEAARLCNYKVIFSAELLNGKDIKDVNDRGETVLHVIARYANNTGEFILICSLFALTNCSFTIFSLLLPPSPERAYIASTNIFYKNQDFTLHLPYTQ